METINTDFLNSSSALVVVLGFILTVLFIAYLFIQLYYKNRKTSNSNGKIDNNKSIIDIEAFHKIQLAILQSNNSLERIVETQENMLQTHNELSKQSREQHYKLMERFDRFLK